MFQVMQTVSLKKLKKKKNNNYEILINVVSLYYLIKL